MVVKVGDIMRRAVINVKKTDGLDKVVKIMGKAGIGGVIVTEKGRVVGILTEKDIIRDVLAKGKDYKKIKVKSIMKHPVRTVPPDLDAESAMRIMRDLEIERLPVVGGANKLIGLVTARDIMRIEPALHEMMKEKGSLSVFTPREKKTLISGECEICGNFSEYLREVNGKLVCEDCRE